MSKSPDVNPVEPMTVLAEAATAVHEMFLAYTDAGFSEPQALYLTAAAVTAPLRPLPPQP